MTIKIRQALSNCLTQIRNKSFNEETIRTLLIVAREFIKTDGLLKELAHFIAHPIRDRGIFHSKLNNRYAKWKLVDDQFQKIKDDKNFFEQIKTESELSDFMLGAIDVETVNSKLFEILYFDGIKDISESHLLKFTGFTRKKAIDFLKLVYKKEDQSYILRTDELTESITAREKLVKKLGLDILDENGRQQIEQIIERDKEVNKKIELLKDRVGHLQRVIRGTIEFNSVFDDKGFSKEIESTLRKLIKDFNLDKSFIQAIVENRQDILLCIMTLMHDSVFTFYDGNQARTFLCFYLDSPKDHKTVDYKEYYSEQNVKAKGVLALYITYKVFDKTNTYPLFVSNLKIKDYFISDMEGMNENDYLLKQIPWTTASRIDNKLRLVKTDL